MPESKQPKDQQARQKRKAEKGSQGGSVGSGLRGSRKDSINDRDDAQNSFGDDEAGEERDQVPGLTAGTGPGLGHQATAQMDSEFDRDSRAGTQLFKQPTKADSLNNRATITPGEQFQQAGPPPVLMRQQESVPLDIQNTQSLNQRQAMASTGPGQRGRQDHDHITG